VAELQQYPVPTHTGTTCKTPIERFCHWLSGFQIGNSFFQHPQSLRLSGWELRIYFSWINRESHGADTMVGAGISAVQLQVISRN
jgi:hypothetical protein